MESTADYRHCSRDLNLSETNCVDREAQKLWGHCVCMFCTLQYDPLLGDLKK
jgi:hypothetical protein